MATGYVVLKLPLGTREEGIPAVSTPPASRARLQIEKAHGAQASFPQKKNQREMAMRRPDLPEPLEVAASHDCLTPDWDGGESGLVEKAGATHFLAAVVVVPCLRNNAGVSH